MNVVTMMGNLGQDPKTKETKVDMAVATFSMAMWDGKDKPPVWVDVVCFKDVAERVVKNLGKGDKAFVTGRLKVGKYTNKDGQDVKTVEVVANTVEKVVKTTTATTTTATATGTTATTENLKPQW